MSQPRELRAAGPEGTGGLVVVVSGVLALVMMLLGDQATGFLLLIVAVLARAFVGVR